MQSAIQDTVERTSASSSDKDVTTAQVAAPLSCARHKSANIAKVRGSCANTAVSEKITSVA